MTRPTNEELHERRKHPPAPRTELRKQLESKVSRWEWSDGHKYLIEPYFKELGDHHWGKTLKEPPADPVGFYLFGFDEDGRLLIERKHTNSASPDEYFTVWSQDAVRRYRFCGDDEATPRDLVEMALDGGLVIYCARPGTSEIFRLDEYEYEDGKVARVTRWTEHSKGDVFKFTWSGQRLEQVAQHYSHGHVNVVWTAKPPSLSRGLREMNRLLPGLVEQVVAAAAFEEAAFCVLLSYSKGSPLEMSLPKVVVGLERERAATVGDGGTAEDVFNPADLESFDADNLELNTQEILAASEEIARSLDGDSDYEKVRKSYVKVTKALNKTDWSQHLATTRDFVVLAVDDELADLFINAKAALSAKQRKAHTLDSPKG